MSKTIRVTDSERWNALRVVGTIHDNTVNNELRDLSPKERYVHLSALISLLKESAEEAKAEALAHSTKVEAVVVAGQQAGKSLGGGDA